MLKSPTVPFRILAALVLALVSVCSASAAPEGRLVAITEMASDKASFDRSEALTVRFTLQNDSERNVQVLLWHTPLAGFSADLFDVERDGEPVPYVGQLVKWGTPEAGDYVEIQAGSSVSATFDPSEVYDMSRPGNYSIRYRAELLELPDARHATVKRELGIGLEKVAVEGSTLTLRLEGIDKMPKGAAIEPMAQAPLYNGCTNSRQTTLQQALNAAENMSTESRGYLQNLPVSQQPTNARYGEWFGAYDSGRYSTVTTNFVAIADAFTNRTVSFFCDCTSSAYAFVYPNRPYEIHLCNAFWSAPLTGTDSQGGTLIHEMSHFDVVANTDDLAYGQSACRKLAAKSPRKAFRNADSHEYFAEAGP